MERGKRKIAETEQGTTQERAYVIYGNTYMNEQAIF